jgi:DNA-binding NarL/FixJ family response regulator
MAKRVILIESNEPLRRALQTLIESDPGFRVVPGRTLSADRSAGAVDVAVVDLSSAFNSMAVLEDFRQASPDTLVIAVGMHPDRRYALRAQQAGARAYVAKETLEEDLPKALRAVARGDVFLSRAAGLSAGAAPRE